MLAAGFVILHLPYLPQSLEDIDTINFALGMRHFDPALHQPHPPGYPLYIALGHISLALQSWLVPALAPLRVEAVALAVWSLVGGALALVAAGMFCRALADAFDEEAARVSRWIVLGVVSLLAVAPLFSISGIRPLSDMPGLAAALLAQAWIVQGIRRPSRLAAGALMAGLAVGLRSQTLVLTAPLLLGVLVMQRGPRAWYDRAAAVVAGAAGCLVWAIPLLVLSGGLSGYLRALESQAGEDFAWVDMVWAHPTARLVALALYRTLALSWGDPRLGIVVAALAVGGLIVAARRARHMLGVVCLAFGPYLLFHMLFQETATIRYALPLLLPVIWLATMLIAAAGRLAIALWAAVAIPAVLVSVPTAIDYGQQAHPAFRAIVDMISEGQGSPPAAVYSHAALYRSLQAAAPEWLHAVQPEREREWLGPVRFFLDGGARTVWFLGDPLRTDMALFDRASVETNELNPWRAYAHAEMGGARPSGALWHRLQPPGWMAGEGWSLTPEAGGRVRAAGVGLNHRPIDAYVRRRAQAATLFIGGFHLGLPTDAATELTASLDGRVIEAWTLDGEAAGQPFLRFLALDGGVPEGTGPYATLQVAARSLEPGRPVPEIAIRQFDLQSNGGRPLMAFGDGWFEDEFAPETGLRWRWTGARAELRLVSTQTAVLRIRGESPVKYVGAAPTVRISAGNTTLATFSPTSDFDWRITVPAEALALAGGVITLETDRTYLPRAAEGSADTRRLGLRIFDCRADLQ